MGKNLHYSIINFIKERLNECDKIETFNFISNDNYYIIQVNRHNPFETFNIYISDEYRYTLTDYYNKPKEIRRGDFIYLARPEANFSDEIEKTNYFDLITGAMVKGNICINGIWHHFDEITGIEIWL